MTITLKNVGARGDGVTDDTAAIDSWLEIAKDTGAKAYAEVGNYLHKGFTIPRGVTVEGEHRDNTKFTLSSESTSPQSILLNGSRTYIRNISIVGNSTTDNGILTTSNGSYFSGLSDINISRCGEVGFEGFLMHNGYIKNASIDKCKVGVKLRTSVGVKLDTIDIARCSKHHLWVEGSTSPLLLVISNVYMETWASSPTPEDEVSMIYLKSLRDRHVVDINGIYINGHKDRGLTASAIHVFKPLSMKNVRIGKVLVRNITNVLKTENVTSDNCNLLLDNITYDTGADPVVPQEGITLI